LAQIRSLGTNPLAKIRNKYAFRNWKRAQRGKSAQ
jgi:hypothetical protein